MNDNHETAPREAVDTSGSSLPAAQNYDIASEDQSIADELLSFDPVRDTRGPVEWIGGSQKAAPDQLTLTMLAPEQQNAVREKLRDVPQHAQAKREDQLVREALYQNSFELRIKAGPGEGANEFQKARFEIAAERYRVEKEMWQLETELAEIERWEPVFDDEGAKVIDPQTQQQQIRAVEKVQGDRRSAMQNRIAEIRHHIELLDGPEGEMRERKGLWKAVEAVKSQQAQLADEKEARGKAAEIVRQERIDARAEAYAKGMRSSI